MIVTNITDSNDETAFTSSEICKRQIKNIIKWLFKEQAQEETKHFKRANDHDDQALIYILVVLSFYSLIIVILMAKYVRKENKELADHKVYEEFLTKARLMTVQQTKYMCARNFGALLKNMESCDKKRTSDDQTVRANDLENSKQDWCKTTRV